MPRLTFSPGRVDQIASSEIQFLEPQSSTRYLTTVLPVLGIANSAGRILSTGSRSLIFTDFPIPAGLTVTGVELTVAVTRLARIQDSVIQLHYQGSLVGRNLARLDSEDTTVYGGASNLWGTENIDFHHPSFGVCIDLQPHTEYPSSNLVYLRSVILALYTA